MKRLIFLGTVIALTLSSCFSSPSTPPQADLQPTGSTEQSVTEPAAQEPVTEPVAQEPVTEPVAQEPVTEPAAQEPVTEPVAQEPATEPAAQGSPVAVQSGSAPQPDKPQPSTTDNPVYNDPCAHGEGCNGGKVDWSQADPSKKGSATDPNPVTNKTMPWNW